MTTDDYDLTIRAPDGAKNLSSMFIAKISKSEQVGLSADQSKYFITTRAAVAA